MFGSLCRKAFPKAENPACMRLESLSWCSGPINVKDECTSTALRRSPEGAYEYEGEGYEGYEVDRDRDDMPFEAGNKQRVGRKISQRGPLFFVYAFGVVHCKHKGSGRRVVVL